MTGLSVQTRIFSPHLSLLDYYNGTAVYYYDTLNRLTGSARTSEAPINGTLYQYQCWGYDSFGNRTYELETVSTSCPAAISPASVNSYNAPSGSRYNWSQFASNNRVSSTTVNSASTSFTYDAAGNVTFDGLNHYVYDTDGRISSPQTKTRLRGPLLCAVWSPGPVNTPYLHLGVPVDRSWSTGRDAEGRRVAKGAIPAIDWPTGGATCNPPLAGSGFAATALYLRGLHGDQDTELTGSGGSWVHTNIFANGGVTATFWNSTKGPDTSYTFSDWLGSKRLQTDSNPVAEAYWQSDPYGDYLNYNGSGGDATEHHFTGKERDTESGIDYFGARYYGSAVGRFMSPDWSAKEEPVPYAKLDDPQSLNLYAYMRNNPLGGVDPDGHCCEEDAEEEINESKEANEELSRINETFNRRETAAADLREQQAVSQFNESHPGGYDDANGVSHVGPASRQDVEQMQAENRDRLFRYNDSLKPESASRLGRKAAEAEAKGLPHGVSTTTKPDPNRPATSAEKSDVQKQFPVEKTGGPNHYTVVLPKPVTQQVADWFNKLFHK